MARTYVLYDPATGELRSISKNLPVDYPPQYEVKAVTTDKPGRLDRGKELFFDEQSQEPDTRVIPPRAPDQYVQSRDRLVTLLGLDPVDDAVTIAAIESELRTIQA